MKLIHLVVAASLSVATAAAGIYAVSATTAANMASSFSSGETTSRARIVELGSAMKRAAADHRAAHAKCKLLAAAKKRACDAAVRAEDNRVFRLPQL